jgi:hypothetical protein
VTAKHSILVIIARYQSAQTGGGVALHSHVLEYPDATSAQQALVALAQSQSARSSQGSGGAGRFVIDAIPLWT